MWRGRVPRKAAWLAVAGVSALLLALNVVPGIPAGPPIRVTLPSALVAHGSVSPVPVISHLASPSRGSDPTGMRPLVGAASENPYWTNLTGAVSPPPLDFASTAYDPVNNYVLLFGGQSASAYPTNYTWIFQNGTWSNITSSAGAAPVARIGMAMAYDAIDHYIVAYGGSDFFAPCGTTPATACNSTWAFYAGQWHVLATTGTIPTLAYSNTQLSMAYDAADAYVLATDGYGTWSYVGGVWAKFCGGNCSRGIPAPDLIGTVTYDAEGGYVLFFGGSYTWTFVGGAWTNITSSSGALPPYRLYSDLAYDSSTGSVLLFGGLSCDGCNGYAYRSDTWSFQSGSWLNVTSSPSPTARYGGSMAYDSADSVVVLFGGDTQLGTAGNLGDTWVWGTSPPIGEAVISVQPAVPLPGSLASFSVSFAGGTNPFAYNWRFGDGGTSSLASPTHAFSSEGYYAVQLWVNDSAGHSANSSLRVHVYVPLALSALRATPSPAALGQPVNFSVNASGGTPPYTYSWNFGDGGVGGNLSNISHIYTTNGPFVAEVSVVDALGGTAHATLNISIKLQALAGSTTSSGAPPLTVDFVGQAQGGVAPYRFEWSFGDGATSPDQNPSHTYNSSGQFTVVLTVLDGRDNRSTSSLTVQVGVPSPGGAGEPGWLTGLVVAISVAVAVGATWTASALYQRSRRREGERWIDELTRDQPPQERAPPR